MPKPRRPKLSDLFKQQHEAEHVKSLMDDVLRGSDRSACIVMTSMIERDLEGLVLTRIEMGVPIREDQKDNIFGEDGVLGNFAGNIKLALALQLITKDTAAYMNIIRRLRNVFAHSAIPISFQTDEIKSELAKFKGPDYSVTDEILKDAKPFRKMTIERQRFTVAGLVLIYELMRALGILETCIQRIGEAVQSMPRSHDHS